MSLLTKIVRSCINELSDPKFNTSQDTMLTNHLMKRIKKFSETTKEEVEYNLKSIKNKVKNRSLSFNERAKIIDNFSKISTGVSTTYLGFLSRLIVDHFNKGGER